MTHSDSMDQPARSTFHTMPNSQHWPSSRAGASALLACSLLLMPAAARGEAPDTCRRYATAAIAAYKTARGCQPRSARWNEDSEAHYAWCLKMPSQALANENRLRANQLKVCSGDSAARRCDAYATAAVGGQQFNLQHRCGYTGQRWSLSYDDHLSWCLETKSEDTQRESEMRNHLTLACQGSQPQLNCRDYAADAVRDVAEAQRRSCGFTGARWSDAYDGHVLWCLSNWRYQEAPPSKIVDGEKRDRKQALSRCSAHQQQPGGTPSAGQEACAWTAITVNKLCVNADGTKSSIEPGSLTARGCGGTSDMAKQRSLLSFAVNWGCSSAGDSPAPGCCTYEQAITPACDCN